MSDIKNTPAITADEKININRSAIEHRATWMGLAFLAAREAGADAEAIFRQAVAKTGCLHGIKIKENLSEPVRLDKFADAFLSPVAIGTFEMEFAAKNADALEIRFRYCPLVAGWLKAGVPVEDIPLLCDIAMDGDRNIAGTVGVGFALGTTIAEGAPVCEVNFLKKK